MSRIVQNSLELSRIVQNCPELSKIVQNCPELSINVQKCPEESKKCPQESYVIYWCPPKEKAKVESLQHELLDQMFMFNIKIDQEQLALQELNEDYKRLQDEGQTDRESFQKTIESLQKSLQDKANVLKEKEESNSILRKEAMDLVARYVILPTKMK